MFKHLVQNIRTNTDIYVKGKRWYLYVLLWLFGLYLFFQIVRFRPDRPEILPLMAAQSFDFMLHEMAHIAVFWMPQILVAAAGSLSEMLLGILLVWGAFKGKSYGAVMIAALWCMLAFQSAGVYMADARAQQLELVSLGGALSGSDKATHDWHYVFGQLGLLGQDTLIGWTVRVIGDLIGIAGLAFVAWVIYRMATVASETQKLERDQLLTVPVKSIGSDVTPTAVPSNTATDAPSRHGTDTTKDHQ